MRTSCLAGTEILIYGPLVELVESGEALSLSGGAATKERAASIVAAFVAAFCAYLRVEWIPFNGQLDLPPFLGVGSLESGSDAVRVVLVLVFSWCEHVQGAVTSPAILGVVPLSIDLNRPVRSRAAQAALVEAVLHAPPSESETNFLEWKGTLDLTEKSAVAKIAAAVLGFSNRMPVGIPVALLGYWITHHSRLNGGALTAGDL